MLTTMLLLSMLAPPAELRPGQVGAGPEPAPISMSWEFEFRFLDPRRIEVQLPGESHPSVYWYMVYTVTNTSTRSRQFYPMFQLVTEDLQVADTDMGISPLVFEAIRERHRATHKFLVSPSKVSDGEVGVGDDYARESVAIWRDIDANLNTFTIYAAGLSGETMLMRNPRFEPGKPEVATETDAGGRTRERVVNPRNFTLRKTLELRYSLPGSPKARPFVEPERVRVRWIMR